MIQTVAMFPIIRPKIGSRIIGGKLCLINQKRGEAWLCQGSSRQVWDRLQQRRMVPEIAQELSAQYSIPVDKALADIQRFVDDLWKHHIVDVVDRNVSDSERELMVMDAPHNRQQSGRIFALATSANTIYVAWLELLIPCNLRCRHCYLDFSKAEIMPLPKVLDILDQLADHGTVELILTGGEIFLRRDLIDIVAYADSRGFLFDLYTNGTLINEKMAAKLAEFAIHKVQISLYGTTAAIHEAITRRPGTFEQSVHAARVLIERGVHVRFQCHIQHDNYSDAVRFPEFAKSLGAEYRFDTRLVPNRNGSTEPLHYRVTLSQQAELYKTGLVDRLHPNSLCTAASSKARVSPAGDIYPCDLISDLVVGNLYRNTLAEIWSSKRRADLRQEILAYKPYRCDRCRYRADCTPCPALRAFRQEGHTELSVSEACMLTKANLMSRKNRIAVASFSTTPRKGGCIDDPLPQNLGQC